MFIAILLAILLLSAVDQIAAKSREYSLQDFQHGLGYIVKNRENKPTRKTLLKSSQVNIGGEAAVVVDEEEPLLQMFTQIINSSLSSVIPGNPGHAKVLIIGAGPAGLCAGYELKRVGFDVSLFESSQRVGGRVKTIREPFSHNLHGEGGAMRLPSSHTLVRTYLSHFGQTDQLEDFDQANKLIYISTFGRTVTYDEFNQMLRTQNATLLLSFPGLTTLERGKTVDQLWDDSLVPVQTLFDSVLNATGQNVTAAYAAVTAEYDQYSLRTFFEQVAQWSQDCISLYDLGSPHVVLDNAFIESWKDGFLSSQSGGVQAGMQQMKEGMEQIPNAFIDPALGKLSLKDNIRYGAKVTGVNYHPDAGAGAAVEVVYMTRSGLRYTERGDYVVFTIPFTAMRLLKLNVPFTVAKSNAIRELRYVEVTKILLQFRQRWWEPLLEGLGQGRDGGLVTDLPIRYAMFPDANSSQFCNGEQRGVIMASYTFQQDATVSGAMSVDQSVQLAADNLATIFGDAVVYDNLEVSTSQVWSADSYSGGSAFCYFGPMQKTRLYGTMLAPEWSGRAYFGGEHASYTHGWIEGAYESALRVGYQLYQHASSR